MALMGTPLVVLLACAAVSAPIATFVLWSRLRGPQAVRGAIRLLMLVGGQVTAVLLAAVLLNDYGQFYTTWSDLFGTDTTPPAVMHYGAASASAQHLGATAGTRVADASIGLPSGRLQLLGNMGWSKPSQRSTRGEVDSAVITGLGSGISAPAYIYLPPQYFSPRYAHHRFPAVEVLSGYPGSALGLVDKMNYPGKALTLVNKHQGVPMIYVMLRTAVTPPRDTECTNIPGGPQAETFLGGELTSAVEHGLRVQPGHWGVVGDSTGGYCAAKLAMADPYMYAGGVSLSGYYHALNGGTAGNLFGGSLAVQNANDLRWLLQHRPAPSASLYLTISKQETNGAEGYPETMKFLRLVKPPMSVTAVIEQTGGHNFYVWDRELPAALRWLSGRITSPAKPPHAHSHRHHRARAAVEAAPPTTTPPSGA